MTTYSHDQILTAFNRAADEIIDAIEADDEGKRDVVNVLINVGTRYLRHPDESLDSALKASYGLSSTEVLDWCRA